MNASPRPEAPISVASARSLAASLRTGELVLFPVRHHSPACALQLRRLFAESSPSVVLVEGPRSFNELIPMLVRSDAKTPLAAYAYAVERGEEGRPERRRAAYYPF